MKYCEKCGNQLLDEAIMCPKCGCAVSGKQLSKEQNEKNQSIAAIKIIAVVAILFFTIVAVYMQINGY